jgi:hypothetical protein
MAALVVWSAESACGERGRDPLRGDWRIALRRFDAARKDSIGQIDFDAEACPGVAVFQFGSLAT